MNILLIGYGKMGKIIEHIALERGHQIAGKIDVDNQSELDTVIADVAIEFSHPDAAFDNIKKCLERNIPVVCGTTGWLAQKQEIHHLCAEKSGSFFYASNYSLGVNIFFKLNEYLARMMNTVDSYDIRMEEIHHTEKKDSPSGTAITLAEGILKHVDRKTKWSDEESDESVAITSLRQDDVPGTHSITYTSAIDDIELKHTAHSREGFAKGAVMVAEWLPGKKGVLGMDDYLKF